MLLTVGKRKLHNLTCLSSVRRKAEVGRAQSLLHEIDAPNSDEEKTLKQKALEWIGNNENSNTRRTYESAFKQFTVWCEKNGHNPYDPTNDVIVTLYLQSLVSSSENAVARSTLDIAAAAIADYHRYEDVKPTDSILVSRTLKIARTMTKKKNPKKPLTVKMMLSMVTEYKKIAKPKFEDVRDICLILIMMAAFLRESEAVALKKDDVWIENMEVDGVERKVLMVYVEKAKNDQERNGHVTMVGGSLSNSELCPVKWFRLYSVTRLRTAEYLFHTNKGNKMAKTTPSGRMKKWVQAIGMNSEDYASHSARIGGTTEANKTGVPTILLKRHGNWKSDVVYDYIRESIEERLSVTAFLG